MPAMPAPAPDVSAWQQVAGAVRPLRLADGSHQVNLQLHPAELGSVHVEVALREGRISLHLVAETAAARQALQQSLPELRADLEAAGLRTDALQVGAQASGQSSDHAAGTSSRQRPHAPSSGAGGGGAATGRSTAADHPSSSRPVAGSRRVDIRL
jgi:flagellar hook-length control protein FliK